MRRSEGNLPVRRTTSPSFSIATSVEGGPPGSAPPSTTIASSPASSVRDPGRFQDRRLAAPVGAGRRQPVADRGEQLPQPVVIRHPHGQIPSAGRGRQRPRDRQDRGQRRRPEGEEAFNYMQVGIDPQTGELLPAGDHHRQRLARLALLDPIDRLDPRPVPGIDPQAVARLGRDRQHAAAGEQVAERSDVLAPVPDRGAHPRRLRAEPAISSRAWEREVSVIFLPASMRATSSTRSPASSSSTFTLVRSPSTRLRP